MRILDTIPDPNSKTRIDPYELRVIGDKAAQSYLNNQVCLNNAVADSIRSSGHALNNHHIQRVVEFANLRVFRELRQRVGGTTGHVVSFEEGPAYATKVISLLRGGTKEAAMGFNRLASPDRSTDGLLDKAEGVIKDLGMHKSAASRVSAEESVDAVDLYLKLGQATEQSRKRTFILEEKVAMSGQEVVRHAASVLSSGATWGDVRRVLFEAAGPRDDLVKQAMDLIVRDVGSRFGLCTDRSMEKISNLRVNQHHPLFSKMAEYTKFCEELDDSQNATKILVMGKERLGRFLRN